LWPIESKNECSLRAFLTVVVEAQPNAIVLSTIYRFTLCSCLVSQSEELIEFDLADRSQNNPSHWQAKLMVPVLVCY
jgi:hypothetical protein